MADNETTVEQDGDTVTLIHAGISYVGPLRDDGSFATAAAEVTVGEDTHALAVDRDLRRRRLRGPGGGRGDREPDLRLHRGLDGHPVNNHL